MMIGVLRRLYAFAGKEQKNIRNSVILLLFYSLFHMLQIIAIFLVIQALVTGAADRTPALQALLLFCVSIIGRAVINRFSQLMQTHAGYFMVAEKRIWIGNKLKRIPMGYFNERSTGELTGITTTVLSDLENLGPVVLVNMLSSLTNSIVFCIFYLLFDWRIGLMVLAGMALYLLVTSSMERKSALLAPERQTSEAALVSSVLEYVQGMGIIKSFSLGGRNEGRLSESLDYNMKSNLSLEQLFTPYAILQQVVLYVFSSLIMLSGALFCISGSMDLTYALMTIIISFLAFSQIQALGNASSTLRLVDSSMEHACEVDAIEELDLKGHDVSPKNHEVGFDRVSFSYGDKPILKDVSFTVKDCTTTAIVGPSGGGKSTVCSLISRFWDVGSGTISLGGEDVRSYTLESLMSQISMVFQDVYLFADTIENNIKFGCPNASHEAVEEAARRAACDEFISSLPDGYDTVIGEGGASLSGGERQRISIARALLKDAPVIILDEATANVDPENEDKLQKAIEELTRNKTIIMIAHRLKTVRNADQILVLADGRIVQRGTHDELMTQSGIYHDFITDRSKAVGWKF